MIALLYSGDLATAGAKQRKPAGRSIWRPPTPWRSSWPRPRPISAVRRPAEPRRSSAADVSLLTAVDQAAKNGTLKKPPSRLQPDGDNAARIWFEDVEFDVLLRWMQELQSRYGVTIDVVDIEKRETAGLVNARLSVLRNAMKTRNLVLIGVAQLRRLRGRRRTGGIAIWPRLAGHACHR